MQRRRRRSAAIPTSSRSSAGNGRRSAQTPQDHYGHKNVIFRDTDEDKVPTRPISALSAQLVGALRQPPPLWQRLQLPLFDLAEPAALLRLRQVSAGAARHAACAREGVDTRTAAGRLPRVARRRRDELFEKLVAVGLRHHRHPARHHLGPLHAARHRPGTSSSTARSNDPEKQTLIEVYSGHGNSEEYRDWRDGDLRRQRARRPARRRAPTTCPCCWQAGEMIRARCGDTPADECERRVATARQQLSRRRRRRAPHRRRRARSRIGRTAASAATASTRPSTTARRARCSTCWRSPTSTTRRSRAASASASSPRATTTRARPGTGYKEFARRMMTEAAGPRDATWRRRMFAPGTERAGRSRCRFDPATDTQQRLPAGRPRAPGVVLHDRRPGRGARRGPRPRRDLERAQAPRGLRHQRRPHPALVRSAERAERARCRWGPRPRSSETPRFRVRAVGAFKQLPGCPDYAVNALSPGAAAAPVPRRVLQPERRAPPDHAHRGGAHPPAGDARASRSAPLIEDPWRRFECPQDPDGCAVEFEDPDFVVSRPRRASTTCAPSRSRRRRSTPAACAATTTPAGNCVEVHPCYGDYRTPYDDDCLAQNEERAWSSPIYVNQG